jgi:hypothetical protein
MGFLLWKIRTMFSCAILRLKYEYSIYLTERGK